MTVKIVLKWMRVNSVPSESTTSTWQTKMTIQFDSMKLHGFCHTDPAVAHVASERDVKERQFPLRTSKHFNNVKQSLHLMQELQS
ncbi:hypothetical protein F2P81_007316 [Scophthalmus maximus]|uniref:Uncharacterized protein n=1 Tax=Scophthalmus maximus TaxID=52904 RepID=A0A6A4TAH5_SCOMX|nr:hypothetical protein F2P81_007316 [Scophthalmus maximus]